MLFVCKHKLPYTSHPFSPQFTPSESVQPRYNHSTTAISLGPALIEVLVFGGRREWLGVSIAETTILRFGEELEDYIAAHVIVVYQLLHVCCMVSQRRYDRPGAAQAIAFD